MKSFKEFIAEQAAYRRKGWLNINTGKMLLFPFRGKSIRPYHDEIVLNNADKFIRGGEKELLSRFADASGFEPEDDETVSMWNDIKSGKVDRDSNLDSILEKEGWRRVVFDEGISSVDPAGSVAREGSKLVKMILDQIPWDNIGSLEVGTSVDLYSEEDAIAFSKTGRVPKRTSIGNTMALFREGVIKGEMLIGWLDPRNKLHLYPEDRGSNRYHAQILTRLLSYEETKRHMGPEIRDQTISDMGHFVDSGDMTREQLNDIIDNSYENMINKLKTGKIDGHYQMEESLMKNGWVKIRIDRRGVGGFSSILCRDNTKRCHDAAKVLDRELGGWTNVAKGTMIIDGQPGKVRDAGTWETYLKTGKVPMRTEIGRTMSQFR